MSLVARDLRLALRLNGVSLNLHQGEVTAICGPNGAGKSSLLTSLAGLVPLASGEVRLDGELMAVLALDDRARRLGYLPQQAELAWDISVETLAAWAVCRGTWARRQIGQRSTARLRPCS